MRGWYNQSYRHSLAARGTQTAAQRKSMASFLTGLVDKYRTGVRRTGYNIPLSTAEEAAARKRALTPPAQLYSETRLRYFEPTSSLPPSLYHATRAEKGLLTKRLPYSLSDKEAKVQDILRKLAADQAKESFKRDRPFKNKEKEPIDATFTVVEEEQKQSAAGKKNFVGIDDEIYGPDYKFKLIKDKRSHDKTIRDEVSGLEKDLEELKKPEAFDEDGKRDIFSVPLTRFEVQAMIELDNDIDELWGISPKSSSPLSDRQIKRLLGEI